MVFATSFPLRKKIRIMLSLMTGSGAVVVALYKGVLVYRFKGGKDSTWDFPILSTLTYVYCSV